MSNLIKILIGDNDLELQQFTRLILEREGYQCLLAQDRHTVLSLLQNDPIDLLILDWDLYWQDESLFAKAASKLRKIGVIMFTPKFELWNDEEIFPDFVDRVVVKPFDIKAFLDTVKEVLKLYGKYIPNSNE
jgi:DNA-binding response OmpR family regulator